jgi:catechol 2,3-dioxygenase-like lactoylglutathione lyase family enzyme
MPQPDIEFNHALIYVSDLKRALNFYRDLLGFQAIEEEVGYARLRSGKGTSTLGLHVFTKEVSSIPSQEGVRLYFEVENLDEHCKELASKGVKFEKLPEDMPWGWRHAYLKDPDGHPISLFRAGNKRLEPSKK